MTSPTVSQRCRAAQEILNKATTLLLDTLALATAIGLAPFRLANIQAAINDNIHAWNELNAVATALELTGADFRDPAATATFPPGA